MILQRRFIIFMLLLITTQPSQLSAAERLEVEIRSTILNIRETRSTHSNIVGVLHKGDRITATTTDMRDWLNLDDGRGFISINYASVLSRTPVLLAPPEETQSQVSPPVKVTISRSPGLIETTEQFCSNNKLPIKASSKTCRKNLSTLGYESCQLLFKLALKDNCKSGDSIKIICSASALATDNLNNQTSYELSNTHIVSRSVSEITMLLEWFPATKSAAIQGIELSDGQCDIYYN